MDLSAGFGTAILGHRAPALRLALRRHLIGKGPSVSAFGWSPECAEVATSLLSLAGRGLRKVQFFSSGAEAVEAALKFAAVATGRKKFMGLSGGFHGLTGIATSLAGGGGWKEGVRTPFGFVETLTSLQPHHIWGRLKMRDFAAVILEPIQNTGGAVEPSSEQIAGLIDACRRSGTLLIADEIASGIARTGRWFAFQNWPEQFLPDLVTVSKALTGGLVPVSSVLCTDSVFDAMFRGAGRAKIHGATMAACPIAMACANAVLIETQRRDACALARAGEHAIRDELARLDPNANLIKLHGRGLMLAVTPKHTNSDDQMRFWLALRDQGVLLVPAAHRPGSFLITPPLTISAGQLRSAARKIVLAARAVSPLG